MPPRTIAASSETIPRKIRKWTVNFSILEEHLELALANWTGPADNGQPFILGSTALHYAANAGKLRLMQSLIDLGADVNAHEAGWYATPLSWAANNAHLAPINLLLDNGASVHSANALHAVAFVVENFELRGKKIPTCRARFKCERMVAGCGTEAPTQDRQRGNGTEAMILMGGSNGVG